MADETFPQVTSYIAWGKESTYGTAATTISNWELWQSFSWDITHNIQEVGGLGTRQTLELVTGQTDGTFNGEYYLQDAKLLAVLGGFTDTVTGTEAPYTHTLVPASTLQSATVEVGTNGTADVIYKLTGAAMNSFTINVGLDDTAKVSVEGMYQDLDDSDTTAQTPTFKTTNPFNLAQINANIDDAALVGVQTASITVTNNLNMVKGLGSALTQEVVPGRFIVNFSVNANMRATTYHDLIAADTGFDFEIPLSESASRSITLTMNNSKITRLSEALDIGGGAVNVDFDGVCTYDSTAGGSDVQSIYIVDVNAIAADYDT